MPLDLLSQIRREIDERLEDLRPLLAEHERLLDAAAALERGASTVVPANAIEHAIPQEQAGNDLLESPNAKATVSAKPSRPRPRAGRRRAGRAKTAPGAHSAAETTILAALEHGSHTVAELAVVTAMSGPSINASLRKLVSEGAVVKTEREAKAAWALAAAA